jgi:hypothetical protein
MARRERLRTIRCAHAGCRETTTYAYGCNREYAEIEADQQRRPWRCFRHNKPNEHLRPDNATTTATVTVTEYVGRDRKPTGILSWKPGGAGLISGPGFIAYAADFPEGTRLVVTARIEMPDRDVSQHECCPPTRHHEGAKP